MLLGNKSDLPEEDGSKVVKMKDGSRLADVSLNIVFLILVWNKWMYYTSFISVPQSVLLHGSIYLSRFMGCSIKQLML